MSPVEIKWITQWMFTHQYIAILQMKAKMGNITLTTILLKKIAFSKVVIVLKSDNTWWSKHPENLWKCWDKRDRLGWADRKGDPGQVLPHGILKNFKNLVQSPSYWNLTADCFFIRNSYADENHMLLYKNRQIQRMN